MINRTKKYSLYCAAFAMLVLAGCSNIFSPAELQESHPQKGLQITIDNPVYGARTLYPDDADPPVFTRYDLYLYAFDGQDDSNYGYSKPIELSPENNTVVIDDLEPGHWELEVKAFMDVNGSNYQAAQSDNIPITIDAQNSFQGVVVPLKLYPYSSWSVPGTFSWDISYHDYNNVEQADLYVYRIGSNYNDPSNNIEHIDLFDWHNLKGSVEIRAGCYMMTVLLRTFYETISWSEVLHIYPSMNTTAERAFTPDDFTKTITVYGNVDIDVQVAPNSWNYIDVEIYSDDAYTDIYPLAGDSFILDNTDTTWSWTTLAPDTPTDVYFKVTVNTGTHPYVKDYIRKFKVSLYDEDGDGYVYKDIALLITDGAVLSGSTQITVNGETIDGTDFYLYAYVGGVIQDQVTIASDGRYWYNPTNMFDSSEWALVIPVTGPASVLIQAEIALSWNKSIFVYKTQSVTGPDDAVSDIDFGDISARPVNVTITGISDSGYRLYVLNSFSANWRDVDAYWWNYWLTTGSTAGMQVAWESGITVTEPLSMLIPNTAPNTLYFVLEKNGSPSYVTRGSVDTSSGSVTLNISQMDPL